MEGLYFFIVLIIGAVVISKHLLPNLNDTNYKSLPPCKMHTWKYCDKLGWVPDDDSVRLKDSRLRCAACLRWPNEEQTNYHGEY